MPYRDAGGLLVCAGTSTASVPRVIASVMEEFRDLKENQVGPEELRRAKDQLKGSIMLGLESSSSRMSNLARQEMYFHRFFTLDELIKSIEIVTAEDVQRISQTFFDQKHIALTVLGNLNGFKIGREDLVC
jgi:predicted Zn-dependent peptidase